jgi:protein-L-isoaspartate(D-aspartate) O-methyltransferase
MEPAAPAVNAEALRAALVETLRARGRLQLPAIAAAFAQVPRHLFVPHVALEEAYRDTFLATKRQPNGEVISSSSQPEIMAIMLEQLDLRPGSGCSRSAPVLATTRRFSPTWWVRAVG